MGGTETHAMTLGLAQAKAGHKVVMVVLGKRGPISDLMETQGLPVYYADAKSEQDIPAILRARKLLKQLEPDVIHSHGMERFVFITLRNLRALRINTTHCCPPHTTAALLFRKSLSFINRWFIRYIDGFIAVSEDVRDQFMDRGIFANCPWRVIYNGIDPAKFYPARNVTLSSKDNDRPIELLMVSRMEPEKHPDDAIRVLALLRKKHALNVRLTLCGDGSMLPTCRELVKELEMSEFVTIAGRRNDVNEFMQRSHGMFVLSDYETFAQVPLEGIASGCPVFAYHIPGGFHEWFKAEGCGGVVSEERTPEALVKKIVPILSDKNRWEQIRGDAIATAKEFSSTVMAEKTVAYYRELLS